MNLRIKELRTHLGLTQQEFADRLGIKRGAVANYELGRNEPIDAVVSLICREFKVNEEWLRTGSGEMQETLSDDEQLVEFMTDLMAESSDSFRRRFIAVVSELDADGWAFLEKIADELAKKKTGP